MINFTPIARPLLTRRVAAARSWLGKVREVQLRQWEYLIHRGRTTQYGHDHDFHDLHDYHDYRSRVPVAPYEALRPYVMRMVGGEADVLWPGVCRRFAQSSGTSDGKSKYIPLTDESLRRCHYRGASDVVSHYLSLYPDSRLFAGKAFILGGSYANELDLPAGVRVGDLSATLIDCINPLANLFRVPSKKVALMEDWEEKLPALVEASWRQNITNISGVPSWFLTVLRRVMERAGASSIHDVWPNLEVFFHGGISFEPYRDQYRAITDGSRMRYMETYNASEGFFALQDDPTDPAMLLLLDVGVFYEFVPIDHVDEPFPPALAPWEVEQGKTYALLLTACNGLWRYPIGDTVTITSVDPLKIRIAGRTRHYINAFGEELMVHNADAAIAAACSEHRCAVENYTAAPVYADGGRRGRHQWLIEFSHAPESLEAFADTLDARLQDVNSDYQAKRYHGIFLDRLSIDTAPRGLFDRWLASTGKLGGQRKVPRLCPDRRFIDPMLAMMASKNDESK